MNVFRKITVKCPNCGRNVPFNTGDWNDGEAKMLFCESENGGCDKPLVVQLEATITAKVARIEWVEDEAPTEPFRTKEAFTVDGTPAEGFPPLPEGISNLIDVAFARQGYVEGEAEDEAPF